MMQSLLSPKAEDAVNGLVRRGTSLGRMTLLSVVVGVTCGLAARALEAALQIGTRTTIGSVSTPGGVEILRWVDLGRARGGVLSADTGAWHRGAD
jgi:hypothetical protein